MRTKVVFMVRKEPSSARAKQIVIKGRSPWLLVLSLLFLLLSRSISSAAELPLSRVAHGAFSEKVAAERPGTPAAGLAKLGQITGYYDANGHYARVMPVFGALTYFELARCRRRVGRYAFGYRRREVLRVIRRVTTYPSGRS